jgi:hypothetical protein
MPNRNADVSRAGVSVDIPTVAALAAMVLVLVMAWAPSHLLLPAIAALAFALAAISAAIGWIMQADYRAGILSLWDFSGACAFIGTAAGIFSDPLQVAQFVGAAIAAS